MKCQVVFLTQRGGTGLDYSVVQAEFMAVFGSFITAIVRELPGRFRLWAIIDLPPERIAQLAQGLGYTQGILLVHEEPFDGTELVGKPRGRWRVGWCRRYGQKVFQSELYVQDKQRRIDQAPHKRHLRVEHQGDIVEKVGHRVNRGLSPLDARFLINITPLPSNPKVLDPFAGFGGLILEGQSRGIRMTASDWEPKLSPGLSQICQEYVIADARNLPFRTASFDAVISEPPFGDRFREGVLDALPELHRVALTGPITLYIAQDMREAVLKRLHALRRAVVAEHRLRRNRGLQCVALCLQ